MLNIQVGSATCGQNEKVYTIAEIGINHNGSLENALRLIDHAVDAGYNAVKFQKRTVDIVYTAEDLGKPRESVFGKTNGDLKYGLEFDESQYKVISDYCKSNDIDWFASPWDVPSVDFLERANVIAHKVASACLTDAALLKAIGSTEKPVFLSTGMSTLNQIGRAIETIGHDKIILLHCVSTYPAKNADLNLAVIETLRNTFNLNVGYSGHEVGVLPSVIAVAKYGACVVERHITLDRSMWGSDQSASLELSGSRKLISYINECSDLDGNPEKRILDIEVENLRKLRRVDDFK
jgi:N-acetylneuraminate synthase